MEQIVTALRPLCVCFYILGCPKTPLNHKILDNEEAVSNTGDALGLNRTKIAV